MKIERAGTRFRLEFEFEITANCSSMDLRSKAFEVMNAVDELLAEQPLKSVASGFDFHRPYRVKRRRNPATVEAPKPTGSIQ